MTSALQPHLPVVVAYAFERLVPMIAAALDDDAATRWRCWNDPRSCPHPLLATPTRATGFSADHRDHLGPTVIPAAPERVATLDYAGADKCWRWGFQPLTSRPVVRAAGQHALALGQVLSTADPVVIGGEIDFEQIAATDPDVILALRSGISAEDYSRLSLIAPVVAVPPGRGDYDLDWREQALLAGLALGRSAEAEAQVTTVEAQIAQVAADHPEWAGQTFAMLTWWDGSVGLYSAGDSSVRTISDMGLTLHPRVQELSVPGEYYITLSQEILPELDADVLSWFSTPENLAAIEVITARAAMRAPGEGREVDAEHSDIANGALAHGSLLSLPAAMEALVTMIEAARTVIRRPPSQSLRLRP